MPHVELLVIGAGLSGLAAARHLCAAGRSVAVLEAEGAVGGRVRSRRVDGFVLDRGFQILLTAYPELQAGFDLDAMDLHPFVPGAQVWTGRGFTAVSDPLRHPAGLWATLTSDVATLADKLRVLRLLGPLVTGSWEDDFAGPDRTTAEALAALGFSPGFVQRFWRPFLGGVFFDPELQTSERMLRFVLRMFAAGPVAVPAGGMGAVSEQLAGHLPEGTVHLGHRVRSLLAGEGAVEMEVEGGAVWTADQVIVATEGPAAAELLGLPAPASASTTTLHFAAPVAPHRGPWLLLDGEGRGPVNHLAVMSEVCPSYAPEGSALLAANVLGVPAEGEDLEAAVRAQLTAWFGPQVAAWRLLATDRLHHALPAQPPGWLQPPERPGRHADRVWVCGDHRDNASVQGALRSGRRVAEAVLAGA